MRRLFILVLLATLFVYHLGVAWPHDAIRWLRCLGGKLGMRIDRDGPYVLLAGIRAVFVTAATLPLPPIIRFRRDIRSCGQSPDDVD